MAYEPKVGDEVVLRARINFVRSGEVRVVTLPLAEHTIWMLIKDITPVPDLGEAELRGEVGGPWAIALSEAQDRIEKRVAALEASAKVRDVPATMVNLAHRVQGIEGTIKTMMEEGRERDARITKLEQRFAAIAAIFRL